MIQFIDAWWTKRKRQEALSDVLAERRAFEDTINADMHGIPRPPAAATYLSQLQALQNRVATAQRHELEDIVSDAETLGQLRAYFCPPQEIADDGHLTIDQMIEWGVPKETTSSLRERFGGKLANPNAAVARSALNAIFAESDSWSYYADNYDTKTVRIAWILLCSIAASFLLAILLMPQPRFALLGLFFAAVGGSCTSVITKIGPLAVTSEFEASLRRIPIRIGSGTAASIIGSGLLSWGFAPIAFHSSTYFDLLLNCATPGEGCRAPSVLGLIAISAGLGFSERVLTWLNDRIATNRE